jgi:hypothetical protein
MAGRLEGWLAGLGLGRYAEAFAAQAIDLDVLAELSEADLRDLGGEALELLRPAFAAIPEGHDTADLVAARKTLDALS